MCRTILAGVKISNSIKLKQIIITSSWGFFSGGVKFESKRKHMEMYKKEKKKNKRMKCVILFVLRSPQYTYFISRITCKNKETSKNFL